MTALFGRPFRDRGPLRRDLDRGVIAGVISGFARWLGWHPWALRGPLIAVLVMNPFAFCLGYVIAWLAMEPGSVTRFAGRILPSMPKAEAALRVQELRATIRSLEERASRLETWVTSDAFALKRRFRDLDKN
jgi:phage shock protein PspC (stress-responsive transcriptional regulator)